MPNNCICGHHYHAHDKEGACLARVAQSRSCGCPAFRHSTETRPFLERQDDICLTCGQTRREHPRKECVGNFARGKA